jgi:adenosylhomocysteine nucleosidase
MQLKTVGSVRLLPVMATTHEFTPALQTRIAPLITGVGPVEAASMLAAALARLEVAGDKPDLIVALGSSGARDLDHARVYQISAVHYRDMDCTAIGHQLWETPFLDAPAVLELAPYVPGLPRATLATGASLVNGAAYDAIGADMADMETYAYARVAAQFGVPLIAFRGVSDGKAALTQLTDWTHTLEEIGEGLCAALDRLEEGIALGLVLSPRA